MHEKHPSVSSLSTHGGYEHRRYQVLYSGNCKTDSIASWSTWSEWSACSKNCQNGEATGTRRKTRTCVGGEVGDLGCNVSPLTELVEPCGMSDRCERPSCTLDMNFVDFERLRLSHTSGVKNSQYWQVNGVYTNRKQDVYGDPCVFIYLCVESLFILSSKAYWRL